MRRKHAAELAAGSKEVDRLEIERAQHIDRLSEAWQQYSTVRAENDYLRQELEELQGLLVPPPVTAVLCVCSLMHRTLVHGALCSFHGSFTRLYGMLRACGDSCECMHVARVAPRDDGCAVI
jgi:hypothetical protein